jgi:glucose-6-phosphate 1-dehydrogenase
VTMVGLEPVASRETPLSRLVLLGAGGDLTARLLMPALAALLATGSAPRDLQVLGVGQDDWDDAGFRRHCADRLAEFAAGVDAAVREDLVGRLSYRRADVTDADALRAVLPAEACVVYLALPNVIFASTCTALASAGVPDGSVLVVEKPFGTGLEDARRLNRLVTDVVPEDSVFRVDHFMAKQTVVNLLGLRFANRIFEPVWNSTHVESVDIVFDETLGLEGRAGYYDHAGALRDMVQNHLLQVLALVVMEPPVSLSSRDLRDRKVDALRSVRWRADRTDRPSSVRGRYTSGTAGGRELPSYVEEPGVDPDRGTETYAEVVVDVDNWRWAGVPFRLRSGKGLVSKTQEVVLTFRPAPHLPFPDDGSARPNRLRLSLKPDAVTLDINVNGPGDPLDLEPAQLGLTMPDHELGPYALLLADVFQGDPILSIRGDEAEESWRIVEPVLQAWRSGAVPLHDYPAGSAGPASSRSS